jgi:hypothetical protein
MCTGRNDHGNRPSKIIPQRKLLYLLTGLSSFE